MRPCTLSPTWPHCRLSASSSSRSSPVLRPILRRFYDARRLQSMHVTFGLLGFSFALAHFAFLVPSIGEHWAAVNHGFFILGPVMALLLLATIRTAMLMRKVWNKVHIFNYAVFIVGVVHGLAIGVQGTMLAMRIIFTAYAALALAGLTYRARSREWRRRLMPVAVRVGRR